MIPKIIHYTWFSDEDFPQQVKECIESWHEFMPNWEYRLWDMAAIENIESHWLKETLKVKKWAFAADFIRLYAVYHFGGVYIDTDVKVFRSFEPLLANEAFIGRENSLHIGEGNKTTNVYLGSHCFGAKKGNEYIRCCLEYYDKRHFILSANESLPAVLKYDMTLLPFIQSTLAKNIGYNHSALANEEQECKYIKIYPSWCFDAVTIRPETYCKHLALGSWREGAHKVYTYNLQYKIKWRIRFCVEWMLRKFNYIMIKLR